MSLNLYLKIVIFIVVQGCTAEMGEGSLLESKKSYF